MKTPLHYASQRGASICAVYLGKRGADLEALDIYGNSPLGVALLSGHHSYGILLIQRQADVRKLVFPVDPEKINKMWKE
jgi:ankyrin repeat protein